MSRGTILIVEDSREINNLLADFLTKNGFETVSAYDGKKAERLFEQNEYCVVLMDLMLPFTNGEELIKKLRTKSNVPVICISAKSELDTRLEVLRLGADDYIIKPFELTEVLVRIEVILRRNQPLLKADAASISRGVAFAGDEKRHGNLVLNVAEKSAFMGETRLKLTAKEWAILELMLDHPAKTFSKANLYESVWGEEYCYEDNTINVHMSNLRSKLKKADNGQEYIETVWGIGYKLIEFEEKHV